MCVTSGLAELGPVKAFTHASIPTTEQGPQWIHYTGYEVSATNLTQRPNCMLLHFPCQGNPWMVPRAMATRHLMSDITAHLRIIGEKPATSRGATTKSTTVQSYGDYHVVLTGTPGDIPDVLSQVPDERRPIVDDSFEHLLWWYEQRFPGDGFVLACFDGAVVPRHPILVGYHPDNDDVLFVPGLDAHDGSIPSYGKPMRRDIKVALGVQGLDLPFRVEYRDQLTESDFEDWAPRSVSGFWDRRPDGPNVDYVVPIENLRNGTQSLQLIDDLVV